MRNDGIRDNIREHLGNGPMTIDELFSSMVDLENRKQLANALYQMAHAGEIERDDDKRYRLPGGAAAQRTPRAAEPLGRKHQPRRGTARTPTRVAPKADGDARAILEALLADAQRALDQYVYSVGDKRILDHLMAARDSARGAFRAYIGE